MDEKSRERGKQGCFFRRNIDNRQWLVMDDNDNLALGQRNIMLASK
jgi:hypothetical protein